jgi:hypothetical protein
MTLPAADTARGRHCPRRTLPAAGGVAPRTTTPRRGDPRQGGTEGRPHVLRGASVDETGSFAERLFAVTPPPVFRIGLHRVIRDL